MAKKGNRKSNPQVDPAAPMADNAKGLSLQTQALRFLISGIIAAVVDLGLTLILIALGAPRNVVAKPVGWVFGTITAYMINRRWTFQSEASAKRAAAVAVLYLTTFAIQTWLFAVSPVVFEGLLGWPTLLVDISSFVIAQGVATVINFVLQRTVIFKVK